MEFLEPESWTIGDFLGKQGKIGFDYKFQRGKTWETSNRQYFMDTILKGWKTSKIVLWKKRNDEYVCVDGRQRLETIFDFFSEEEKKCFPLSEWPESDFSGKKHKELSPSVIAEIKSYSFQIDLIESDLEKEVAEYFIRLQVGVPLNAAEKLNAVLGAVRDLAIEISEHKFFTEIVPFLPKRFLHRYLAAQILLLAETKGAHNLKYKDLRIMYGEPIASDKLDETREEVKKRLDYLVAAFKTKSPFIKNRAAVISLFYFVHKEYDNLSLSGKGDVLAGFFKAFQKELDKQSHASPEKTNRKLERYRSFIIQAADTASAITGRHDILRERFTRYEARLEKHTKA